MKLIVGLGNPGKEYENTRHNIGFKAIDAFIHKHNIKLNKNKFTGKYHRANDFIICKPQTYMNNSGMFVQAIAHFYKIKPQDILIVYDDMDLPVGNFTLKPKGSAGGQKGMIDIIVKLNTTEIPRLKIGIGRPKHGSVNYVLGAFTPLQLNTLNSIKEKIVSTIENFVDLPFEKAATIANTK